MKRVLATASGGGHWEQLMLLVQDFPSCDLRFATTDAGQAAHSGKLRVLTLPDCNLTQPISALHCAVVSLGHVWRFRPQVVISTGAAPGFFCILWGRMLGARTLWIDSIANADQISLSGRMALLIGARCLTQWEHLANDARVEFKGSVL
ncbi:MAG: glucuronosyltransferase [Alphaproteobacteria bacterium]|nr:MAG: glucuronosyltransferase [Alphaproteobacteria bacterium]